VFQKWRWTEIAVTLRLIFTASLRKKWPMTFNAVRCPHCQSDHIVKRGKTVRGTQRYLCQNTRCTKGSFLLDSWNRGCLPEVKQTIIAMRLNASAESGCAPQCQADARVDLGGPRASTCRPPPPTPSSRALRVSGRFWRRCSCWQPVLGAASRPWVTPPRTAGVGEHENQSREAARAGQHQKWPSIPGVGLYGSGPVRDPLQSDGATFVPADTGKEPPAEGAEGCCAYTGAGVLLQRARSSAL
jgi:hypothetical protein